MFLHIWGMYLKTNDIFFFRNLLFDKFFSLTVCPLFNNLDVVHQVDFNDSSCEGNVRLVIMFLQIILYQWLKGGLVHQCLVLVPDKQYSWVAMTSYHSQSSIDYESFHDWSWFSDKAGLVVHSVKIFFHTNFFGPTIFQTKTFFATFVHTTNISAQLSLILTKLFGPNFSDPKLFWTKFFLYSTKNVSRKIQGNYESIPKKFYVTWNS